MATAQEIAAAQALVKMGTAPTPIRAPSGPIYWQAPGSGAAAPRRRNRKSRKERMSRKTRRSNRRNTRRSNRRNTRR